MTRLSSLQFCLCLQASLVCGEYGWQSKEYLAFEEIAQKIIEMKDVQPLVDGGWIMKQTGLEQYAIQKFAEALEVVPCTLAENAGMNTTNTLAGLRAEHAKGNIIGIDSVTSEMIRAARARWDLRVETYDTEAELHKRIRLFVADVMNRELHGDLDRLD